MKPINGKKEKPTEFRNLTREQQEDAIKYGYDGSFPTAPDMVDGNIFVKQAVLNAEFKCGACDNLISGSRFVLFGMEAIYRLVNLRAIQLALDASENKKRIILPGGK